VADFTLLVILFRLRFLPRCPVYVGASYALNKFLVISKKKKLLVARTNL